MVRIEKAGRGRKLKRRISALPWLLRLRDPFSAVRVATSCTSFLSRVTRSIEIKEKKETRKNENLVLRSNFSPISNRHSSLGIIFCLRPLYARLAHFRANIASLLKIKFIYRGLFQMQLKISLCYNKCYIC